jgi:hypothetical protein
MSKVTCSEHGTQDETFVCQHIVRGLEENVPYGFWWAGDSDQLRPNAWCTMCNELVAKADGTWTEEVLAIAQVTLLCAACYDRAKAMNLKG